MRGLVEAIGVRAQEHKRDAVHGAQPRRARGADFVRAEARGVVRRDAAAPAPHHDGEGADLGREDIGAGGVARDGAAGPRGRGLRAAGAAGRADLDAGGAPRPARAVHVDAGAGGGEPRQVRDGDTASSAHGGAGGRGAVLRGADGVVVDAAQAEPREVRADQRTRAAVPRIHRFRRSRTWRSGTSGTSRTRRSSG